MKFVFIGVILGIGKELVRVLVMKGVYVIMVIWNLKIGEEVKLEIIWDVFKVWVEFMKFDFFFLVLVW